MSTTDLERDRNRTLAIARLELKIQRAGVLGQQHIVERYTGYAAKIRERLGTGPTVKPRRQRRVLLGIADNVAVHDTDGEHPAVMPLVEQPFELDGQERAPGYGV